jgi:hypothetical protein
MTQAVWRTRRRRRKRIRNILQSLKIAIIGGLEIAESFIVL